MMKQNPLSNTKASEVTSEDDTPKVPKGAESLAVLQQRSFSASFSGPIPPPEHLRQYKDIDPQIVDFILKDTEARRLYAERIETHKYEMEKLTLQGNTVIAKISMIFGFLLCLSMLGVAVASLFFGYPFVSMAMVGVGFIGILGACFKLNKDNR